MMMMIVIIIIGHSKECSLYVSNKSLRRHQRGAEKATGVPYDSGGKTKKEPI
jgi:hypothetical protein